jgi:dihydroorotate dehydrogenase
MNNFYSFLRQILFTLPPEFSHDFTLRCLEIMAEWKYIKSPSNNNPPIKILGLEFPNCLGAAAGIDKDGDYIQGLAALGFGFIELGTVTPKPQAGNPKPRLFRLTEDDAVINRMGFNNKGVDYLVNKIQQVEHNHTIIGINIGKNASTPIERAIDDYSYCLKIAYPWANYITVNISSPNTTGLRDLQQGSALIDLLSALKQQQKKIAEETQVYKPLLVKIAPDLSDDQIKTIAELLQSLQIDGVIATNTTISREKIINKKHANETGGLSGRPLLLQSTHVVQVLRQALGKDFPIVAVGGIMSAEDAKAKLAAGANLLQTYTGLVYCGPKLVRDILEG